MRILTVLSVERDEDTVPVGHPLPVYETLLIVIPMGLAIGTPVAVAVAFDVVGSNPPSPGIESVGRIPAITDVGISSIGSSCIMRKGLAERLQPWF